jgi:hypothetical protein
MKKTKEEVMEMLGNSVWTELMESPSGVNVRVSPDSKSGDPRKGWVSIEGVNNGE